MTVLHVELPDGDATLAFGARLAAALGALMAGAPHCVVYLEGDLGAGKTTLARGLLQAAGHAGNVRSPTYTLVEEYRLGNHPCFHLDLYRVVDPGELEFIGLRDMRGLLLIEWPSRGGSLVPPADLRIGLAPQGEGRRATCEACTAAGEQVLAKLREAA